MDNVRHTPASQRRVKSLRDRLLDTPELKECGMTLWKSWRARIEAKLAEPRSRLRQGLSGLLRSLGTTIAEDTAVQARMDARIEEVVLALMEPWRKGAGQFVADVVRGWESQIGRAHV